MVANKRQTNILNILIISHFHLLLGLPSGLFASGFPVNKVHGFSPSAIPPYLFYRRKYIGIPTSPQHLLTRSVRRPEDDSLKSRNM